jgi:hypothetical protein
MGLAHGACGGQSSSPEEMYVTAIVVPCIQKETSDAVPQTQTLSPTLNPPVSPA